MPRYQPSKPRTFASHVPCLWLSLLLLGVSACDRASTDAGLLAGAEPSGESPWLAAERQRFVDILSESAADVLVVPFQTSGYSFDSAERTLLASRIAGYIEAHTDLTVADPQLVGRALGEGWRRLDDADIRALAAAMQASHVVIGVIGHDRNRSFHVTIRSWSTEKPGEFEHGVTRSEQSWNLPFSNEQYPHQVFTDQLAAVAEALQVDIQPAGESAAPPASPAKPAGLPELETLLDQPSILSPSRLHLLQLAALAFPWSPDRPIERAWVRTLNLAYRQPGDAPDRNLLIARALAHLGRRPAALALLAEARTPAERSLREWLNGNLPQGEREAAAIDDPVQQLIAHIELGDMRWAYGQTSREREQELLASFMSEDSQWWPVVLSRLSAGTDGWPSTYLTRFFPLSETGWEGVRDRVEWLWDDVQLPYDMTGFDVASAATALEYQHQWTVDHAADLAGEGTHGTWLLLDLLAARVESNSFEGLGRTYGQPARFGEAREEIARAERYFAGHPDIAALKARIEWKEYDRYLGAEQARWLAAALQDTEDAFWWSQGLRRRLISTDYYAPDIPEVSERLDPYRDAYFWDLPGDIYWLPLPFRKDAQARMHYRDTVLAYSVSEFDSFEWLLKQQEGERWLQVVRDSIRNRFSGNPAVAGLHAAALRDGGDLTGAESAYRAIVSRKAAPYSAYDRLAEVLIEQGRFAEAFEVVDSYPGFERDSGENRIHLSNHAEFSARLFWRIGQFDYALPLLQLSASYHTNSSAEMTSKALLALESGDYGAAARIRMKQARTYRNFVALNRYLALAFARGEYAPAWAIFEEVHRDGNGGQLLSQMALSVRAERWTDEQVRDWLSEERIRVLADGNHRFAAHAAVAAFVVDREPPQDLPELVRELQGISPYIVDDERRVGIRNPGNLKKLEGVVCGPSDYGSSGKLASGQAVDSHLVYFTDAYLALEGGDYGRAQDLLEEAASLFDYFAYYCENTSYILPYLALSAALNGDTERLLNYLDDLEFKYRRTHYHLARAIIAGVAGKEEEALEFLDKAVHRWESNRFRTVPTRYLYADMCRRLYELTGSEAYRERLLWWLGVQQRHSPADAWAYAIEARIADDPAAQRRALALTLLLDPHSGAVGAASAAELAAAREWLVENNPFEQRSTPAASATEAIY